ncbi:hypothetical protein FHW71_003853 [Enterobacter sp. Sphag1F]|jgi:hypothetical protein|nr:hypothetical protein [Enterobacter sp. Sphag1F]NYI16130.1 hypothetical protein [Enterobacter sp. Sphag71]
MFWIDRIKFPYHVQGHNMMYMDKAFSVVEMLPVN